jgi:exopolysaccharide biosynthesis polyprenyl glycosylphosphotransferase
MTDHPHNAHTLGAAADSLMAFALVVGAVLWANHSHMPPGGPVEFLEMRTTLLNASFSIVFAILWRQCFDVLSLYVPVRGGLLQGAFVAATGCALMTGVVALYLNARHAEGPVPRILQSFFIAALLYELLRVLASSRSWRWRSAEIENVVILGSGRRASKAWRELRVQHHHTKRVLGFVDDQDPAIMAPDIASRYLGRVDDLSRYLLRNVVDELVVAAPLRSGYDMTQRAVSMAEAAGVRVVCLNDIFTLAHGGHLRLRANLFVELVPKDERYLLAEHCKRALDVLGAVAGLLLLSPIFLLVAIAVKATSAGPVFFSQERFGYRRRRFRIWKFRTMVRNAPELWAALEPRNEAVGPIFKIKDDPRITPIGRVLRRTSIDELPQLWNVLRGEMSLVGPRPMSVRDVAQFDEAALMRRFSVRPGITGMLQVAGRGSLNFEQWIALDFNYIDDWSLGLDLRILARTVPVVLKRSGAA